MRNWENKTYSSSKLEEMAEKWYSWWSMNAILFKQQVRFVAVSVINIF